MRLVRDGFTIDDDPVRLWPRLGQVSAWLVGTSWAGNRDPGEIVLSWENAGVAIGLYEGAGKPRERSLVGCCRAVTDFVRIAYLSDVYVDPARRGRGLGAWMVESMLAHPDLEGVRWMLDTRDAHGLYRRFGFVATGGSTMHRPPRQADAPGEPV